MTCARVCLPLTCLAAVLSSGPAHSLPPQKGGLHVVKTFQVGGEGGWDYVTADSGSHRLFISRSTHVMVMDYTSGTVVGDIPNTAGVHGIALAPTLRRGFTSNGADDSVTIFNLTTLAPVMKVKVGSRPDSIVYEPQSRRVFTFNGGSDDCTAVDATTGKVVGSVPLGGRPEAACVDGRGHVFVNIEDRDVTVELDAGSLEAAHRWPVAPGEGPGGIAADGKRHRLFIACGNDKMVVLSSDNGSVLAALPIGKGSDAASFDPGEGLAFSSNGRDGTLTVVRQLSADKYEAVDTVATAPGARTMAVDTRRHQILLVTATPLPSEPGSGRRRAYEPGSFRVLVVGR